MSSPGTYRLITIVCAVLIVALLLVDVLVFRRRARYEQEIERLRSSMTAIERERTAAIVSQEDNKLRVAIELLRRQARRAAELHLSVTIDSGTMYLEREGAVLREMPIYIGPERPIGAAPDTVRLATPRGERTIAQILTENDSTEIPEWVYFDRGLAPPADRSMRAPFGAVAVLMDGGTLIYSLPTAGPLADSSYVLPGSVRARTEDLRAILPNLKPGLRVYFY